MKIIDSIETGRDELGRSYTYSNFPMGKEYWFDIPKYVGMYQVSNWGRVKSLDRIVDNGRGGTRASRGRVLKAGVGKPGYDVVVLSDGTTATSKNVHQKMYIS